MLAEDNKITLADFSLRHEIKFGGNKIIFDFFHSEKVARLTSRITPQL